MKLSWQGVMPALLTPFKSNDSIDFLTFEKNTRAQLDAGVHGLVLGGTLGEASTLRLEEKSELIQEAKLISNGSVPVIMNVAEASTSEALKSVTQALRDGADGLMVLPPMRYKADSRETVHYFQSIAKHSDLPIMIYNNPVDYGIEVTIPMFEELLQCETIQAVKESTRVTSNITKLRNAFGQRLAILTGVDTIAFESLMLGADGWVAGLVDAFPKETVAIYELVKKGEYAKAKSINDWFMPLLELDVNSKLVQNIKLAAQATGLGTEFVRLPRLPLEGVERQQVEEIINFALKKSPQV
ncbi:MAG: dihydrodipicolinate synthase family protein [Bacteroidetes bacterium]|nr:dihydrodipicolinate synthase family protein [Bacteroidota bacterium]MDA0879229.1 dihydrodipicolinate synthase family protein [Bacteroidota bacterium]MDA1114838.1 dihydrodipicolinate synthase family protein [Bacteroidota bacterium]